MATKLTKPVKRELQRLDRAGRAVVMTVQPSEILEFRYKGTRRKVSVSIGHCLFLAEWFTILDDHSKKVDEYNSGKRKRKPKKPFAPIDSMYLKILNMRVAL